MRAGGEEEEQEGDGGIEKDNRSKIRAGWHEL